MVQSPNDLADVHRAQGKDAGSGPLYQRVQAIRDRIAGIKQPDSIKKTEADVKTSGAVGMEDGAKDLEARLRIAREKASQEKANQQIQKE